MAADEDGAARRILANDGGVGSGELAESRLAEKRLAKKRLAS
jgi:hypothetical protein